MEKDLKYFEINNQILDDFDSLMQTHLDQVEYLKINKSIKNTKLFNIISLCLNLKTIEIDGDFKTDTNRIFGNICKMAALENIVINNAKVPNGKLLNKFINIKSIKLQNIKFSNVKNFFEEIGKNVEEIELKDVDFDNSSLEVFNRFTKLKSLKLKNLIKAKFEKLDFIKDCIELQNIEINSGKVGFLEVENIISRLCNRKIKLLLESKENFNTCIDIENEKTNIKICASDLKELSDNADFSKITNLEIVFTKNTNFEEFVEIIKNVQKQVKISVTEICMITTNQSKLLKQKLNIKTINIVDKNGIVNEEYNIDDFIKIRNRLDILLERVPEEKTQLEKYLILYKLTLKNIKYGEEVDDNIRNAFLKCKAQDIGYTDILGNCLICLKIDYQKVKGKLKKENKTWNWLQVKINNTWYNSDIAFDSKYDKKMKYALVSNDKLSRTHEFSNLKYCVDDFNPKAISEFWKEGKLTQDKNIISNSFLEKIKRFKK